MISSNTKMKDLIKPAFKVVNVGLKIIVMTFLPVAVFILFTSKTDIFDGMRSMVVLTGSMQPTIPVGSIVLVEKDNWYMKGDVIAFKNKGDLTVTHRIVEKVPTADGELFKVKGDANNAADGDLVSPKAVIGKTIFHIPYIGSFVGKLYWAFSKWYVRR